MFKMLSMNYGKEIPFQCVLKCITKIETAFIHQSNSTVNNPLGNSRGFAYFARSAGFPMKSFAQGGAGFRSGQIFPEVDKNLQQFHIFRQCFQEAIKNGQKKCLLS